MPSSGSVITFAISSPFPLAVYLVGVIAICFLTVLRWQLSTTGSSALAGDVELSRQFRVASTG